MDLAVRADQGGLRARLTAETLLYRQIHPSFVQNGRVTSQAFRPTPKDENQLSVYDGDQIEPEPSWRHYTGELEKKSVGVLGVTLSECSSLSLPAQPDPTPFPEHVLIDFSAFASQTRVIERLGKQLRDKAEARDWLYQAEAS